MVLTSDTTSTTLTVSMPCIRLQIFPTPLISEKFVECMTKKRKKMQNDPKLQILNVLQSKYSYHITNDSVAEANRVKFSNVLQTQC